MSPQRTVSSVTAYMDGKQLGGLEFKYSDGSQVRYPETIAAGLVPTVLMNPGKKLFGFVSNSQTSILDLGASTLDENCLQSLKPTELTGVIFLKDPIKLSIVQQ
jgi:hypothetical protein